MNYAMVSSRSLCFYMLLGAEIVTTNISITLEMTIISLQNLKDCLLPYKYVVQIYN